MTNTVACSWADETQYDVPEVRSCRLPGLWHFYCVQTCHILAQSMSPTLKWIMTSVFCLTCSSGHSVPNWEWPAAELPRGCRPVSIQRRGLEQDRHWRLPGWEVSSGCSHNSWAADHRDRGAAPALPHEDRVLGHWDIWDLIIPKVNMDQRPK